MENDFFDTPQFAPIYDAKQGGTFVSGRWGTATTPDLCFVTTDCHDQSIRDSHTILHNFPRTQHKQ